MRRKIWLAAAAILLPIAALLVFAWGHDTNWSHFYTGVNDEALKYCNWKSVEGDYMGDFLYFRSPKCPDCGISVDNKYDIYFGSVKKGRVINATSDRLVVEDLKGHRGYYCCK